MMHLCGFGFLLINAVIESLGVGGYLIFQGLLALVQVARSEHWS